jgi:hypothetical protein
MSIQKNCLNCYYYQIIPDVDNKGELFYYSKCNLNNVIINDPEYERAEHSLCYKSKNNNNNNNNYNKKDNQIIQELNCIKGAIQYKELYNKQFLRKEHN